MSHYCDSDIFSHNLLTDRGREHCEPSKDAESVLILILKIEVLGFNFFGVTWWLGQVRAFLD